MTGLQRAERALYFLVERPALNILLWFAIALLLYGLSVHPFQDYWRIAQNPFITDQKASFYQDSILLPVTTYYLGLHHNLRLFLVGCLLVVGLVFVVFGYLPRKNFGPGLAVFVPMALALHPVSLVLLNWLGSPDGVTVLLSGVLAFANSWILIFGAAAVGVLNHPQMLVIAPAIGLLRMSAGDEGFSLKKFLVLGAGCALGYTAASVFLNANGIEIASSRLDMMLGPGIKYWWDLHLQELPLSVFSLYNGLWFILAICLVYGFRRRPKYYLVFLSIQLAALVLAFFSWDLTRIFGLLTLASALHCMVYTLALARSNGNDYVVLRRVFLIVLIATLWMPKYVAWYGSIVQPAVVSFWMLLVPAIGQFVGQPLVHTLPF